MSDDVQRDDDVDVESDDDDDLYRTLPTAYMDEMLMT